MKMINKEIVARVSVFESLATNWVMKEQSQGTELYQQRNLLFGINVHSKHCHFGAIKIWEVILVTVVKLLLTFLFWKKKNIPMQT